MNITVSPAYGRDYKSRAAALADWNAGRDFILEGTGRWAGKPINKSQADADQLGVTIRFNGLRSSVAAGDCCTDCEGGKS